MLKDPEMISVETASVAGTVSFDETIATTTSTAPDQLIQNVVLFHQVEVGHIRCIIIEN